MQQTAKASFLLLVEDNPADAALIRRMLKDQGIGLDVVLRTDGEAAIEFLSEIDSRQETCPTLVILDLNLPKKSGLEVLERIRQSGSCRTSKVVIFSSSDAEKEIREAISLGATRYIRKPSSLDAFLKVGAELKALLDEPQ